MGPEPWGGAAALRRHGVAARAAAAQRRPWGGGLDGGEEIRGAAVAMAHPERGRPVELTLFAARADSPPTNRAHWCLVCSRYLVIARQPVLGVVLHGAVDAVVRLVP